MEERPNQDPLCVVGGTHGHLARTREVVDDDAQREPQVGDLGRVPNLARCAGFIDGLDASCTEAGLEWWFIGGNRDVRDDLDRPSRDGERDTSGAVAAAGVSR